MKKFAFIGAGSYVFTRELVKDIFSYPHFADSEIALMDVDVQRLNAIRDAVTRMVETNRCPARITATTRQEEALAGADGVICTIKVGGSAMATQDIEIPMKYGVDINIGDTMGPAAIFRAMRTVPVLLNLCADMERICPDAALLNYTNPMSMLCCAMQRTSKIQVVGLCHSVQDCAAQMERWMGLVPGTLQYLCAGINHQSWYLKLAVDGKDAYPMLRKALENPVVYQEELVRNDMLLHLGYMVTESSGHNSEYNPWYRKRKDLLEKYCTHSTGNNPGLHGKGAQEHDWAAELAAFGRGEVIALSQGHEYAAQIFNALMGDGRPFRFHGNVLNHGVIENLPWNACVEVPMLASRQGLEAIRVGALPAQLQILNNINASCHTLAVEGILEKDSQKIYHAICYDPLTSAVLTLSEISHMVEEMFRAERAYLDGYSI